MRVHNYISNKAVVGIICIAVSVEILSTAAQLYIWKDLQ